MERIVRLYSAINLLSTSTISLEQIFFYGLIIFQSLVQRISIYIFHDKLGLENNRNADGEEKN